ncbi:hypothetical protein F5Y19DRAFT_83958 [Xylariaceae sp. FL1651]|nr:hypothetical protein F5Y19DRAFT_83958 [Xylariaceae sp. FL1651]
MPANNNRQTAAPTAASPTPKTTAKYTNKDGTKYISVPKSSASTPPAQPSPTTTSSSRSGAPTNGPIASEAQPPATVNKKKQKRRAKAAAKAAAEREHAAANGLPSPSSTTSAPALTLPGTHRKHPSAPHDVPQVEPLPSHNHQYNDDDWGEETESDDGHQDAFAESANHLSINGLATKSKKGKKKKKAKKETSFEADPPRPSGISREKIWNTSGPEERERIKQFWLGLGEDERKSLVKVEKDAVLRKMKEQQKHTCSCSVCGRKRTAIEEELEGLYDAYYQELESFANQPHSHPNGPPMFTPKRFGPMSGLHPPGVMPSRYSNHHPSRGRIVEHVDNDEDDLEGGEEEYSDEEDLEDDEDEDEPEEIPRDPYANDFFNFGQSLTVKGGILTVADDLLKNDGKKFIEMMEQLAERRMAREEDATHYSGGYGHTVNGGLANPHNHPPPEDEEYDDEEEEDEEYESQEEDYEEEEDQMTEEQRMEEGRRMFQIFAARMFEQRVLTAYREKVAKERQEKLLEELAQEETQESQRKAKKAKDAQKRKEKALQKKQALLEEKARRDAEKAAEEEARLAEETRRIEEARAKAEERRQKKEAQKKAEEDERLRREAEKQRRAHEQKEKQAEQERKTREAKEREKKLKEEQRRKEQEARDIKERETRERREKHEKDKREKELRAAQAKAERETKEKIKQEEKTTIKAPSLATPIPTQPAKKQHPVSIPALPHQPLVNHASPQITVATPALPMAHTPMKPRSVSQEVTRSVSQASHSASGPSQTASPHALSPLHASPGPIGPPSKASSAGPPLQPMSPHHSAVKGLPGIPQGPFDMGMPPMPIPIPGIPPMVHSFPRMHEPIFPPMAGQFRPPGIPVPPPGLGGPIGGRPFHMPPPGFPQPGVDLHMPGLHQPFSTSDNASGQPSSHSRQGSASFDTNGPNGLSALPIGKPTPIGRPESIVHGQRNHDMSADIEDMSNHLGSSALLDDTDEPLLDSFDPSRRGTVAPGTRPPFPGPAFMNPAYGSPGTPWGAPGMFPPPPGFGHAASNTGWPPNLAFGVPPPITRAAQPRSVVIRQLLVRACKDLENYAADASGYIELSAIKGHVDSITPSPSESIDEAELLDICETEGNPQNGGGSFDIRRDDNGKVAIRFEVGGGSGHGPFPRNVGAPGEIGSPIVGAGTPFARG